ncbi:MULTISPECIES: hypothetical protein [Rhizobium]|uniref:Uncharacterized protein n=2 Tax=Rhizobium TaxID=379 RepID=K0PTA7_9HYPH|nr:MULTISPECIES: hypothetical protein [Rhizobium]KWV43473.1 hypothetical protein AS026_19975 [Rhizobium altiplani]CCM79976.1 hypothetical protein BN77_p2150009 [Rhizobium mesoamericanum STM3625]
MTDNDESRCAIAMGGGFSMIYPETSHEGVPLRGEKTADLKSAVASQEGEDSWAGVFAYLWAALTGFIGINSPAA